MGHRRPEPDQQLELNKESSEEPVRRTVKLADYIAGTYKSAEAIEDGISVAAPPTTDAPAPPFPITGTPTSLASSRTVSPAALAPNIITPALPITATGAPATILPNTITLAQPVVPIIDALQPSPARKKKALTLRQRMEAEEYIIKQRISPGDTVQTVSKVLVKQFGPIFSRVVEHFAPDEEVTASVYAGLAAQFSTDLEAFIEEKMSNE